MKSFLKNWILPPEVTRLVNRMRTRRCTPVDISTEYKLLFEKNLEIKNRHRGERCFIIGAGSSIKIQDIRKLKNEVVIGVSNTFVHPDYSWIRPRYHVLPHILYGHSAFYEENRFISWLRQMEKKTFDAEMFFHIGDKNLLDENFLFRGRTIYWNEYAPWSGECQNEIELSSVPSIWSVSEYAITVALYLGFDEIYLLGFDHDWFNGLFNYFYDEKTEHAMRPDISLFTHVDSEFQMRRHADIFKKYKCLYRMKKNIYNANANQSHYLDVFPKIDFNSLFK
jgi:hypothetical protein